MRKKNIVRIKKGWKRSGIIRKEITAQRLRLRPAMRRREMDEYRKYRPLTFTILADSFQYSPLSLMIVVFSYRPKL